MNYRNKRIGKAYISRNGIPTKTIRAPRQKTHENIDKGEMIIKKAISLFSENGYDQVKVSDITNSLNIGYGTFYLYFRNKKELLYACFQQLSKLLLPLETRKEIRDAGDFFKKVPFRMAGFAENYSRFGGILNILRASCGANDEDEQENAKKVFDIMIEPLRSDIKLSIEKGAIWNVDPDIAAHFMFGAADCLAFRLGLDSKYTIQEICETVSLLAKKALAVDKPSECLEEKHNNMSWTLMDKNGLKIEIKSILFNDKYLLSGKIGEGEITIDPSSISILDITDGNSECNVHITSQDGKDIILELNGETVVSGATSIGVFHIHIKNVSSIKSKGC